jgi:GT2 family glycosyltransferase
MTQPLPDFSIIIPSFARPQKLVNCLQAFARLESREGFEVIVVDDGGEVALDPVVVPFQGQFDVRVVCQRHLGPAAARNTGAAVARGKWLAFTDDDCAPAPDWLRTLANQFAATPDCMLGGRTVNALAQNRYSSASQLLIDYLYAYYNAEPNDSRFFTSNNLAVPAVLFQRVGGFDTGFPNAAAEDRELCDRWRHFGYHMVFVPGAVIHHAHELTFASFWHQHFAYGRGAYRFHQTRQSRASAPMHLEPLTFYLRFLKYPFRQPRLTITSSTAMLTLFLVSQIANGAGFCMERWSQRSTR